MKLSIVIVNYNVRYFIDQCIRSIELAVKPWEVETIVVDNNSSDQSVDLIRAKYPGVKLIANKENVGFSVACNQGLKKAKGEYILFLNPDTILKEDSLVVPVDLMDKDKSIGAAGVKMVDGSGNYLPESKRGLPTPFVAFCKASGLSGLFPRSALFNQYHMGHLPADENAEVDVLSGAFFLVRKKVLNEIGGGFDEDFFMYGEDIDLSYRISLGGYKLYYVAETSIIHFKGESTKKVSFNYIRTFYKAMEIFADKHFNRKSVFFKWFLKVGIYIKALLSLLRTFIGGKGRMIADFILLYLGFAGGQLLLGQLIHGDKNFYPETLVMINLPIYAIVWVLFLYLFGYYSRYRNSMQTLLAVFFGGLFLVSLYGLMEAFFRSSRAVLLFSGVWTLIYVFFSRSMYNYLKTRKWSFTAEHSPSLVLVGKKQEVLKALDILQFNQYKIGSNISISTEPTEDEFFKGTIEDIDDIVHAYQPSELIFCDSSMRYDKMMEIMALLGTEVKYRILTAEGDGLISSFSSRRSGELFSKQVVHRLSLGHVRWQKRFFDLMVSLVLLPILPALFILFRRRVQFLKDWLAVVFSFKIWVGYYPGGTNYKSLPDLRKSCLMNEQSDFTNAERVDKYNYHYSLDYSIREDLEIFLKTFFKNYL